MRRSLGTPGWNLALGTVGFALCFTAWSLIAPFAKTFKADLDLSYTEALLLTAVPVVLGSLLRIPMGVLTDRYGGRLIFAGLLAFSALPAVLFGYADGYAALIGVGFLLGVAWEDPHNPIALGLAGRVPVKVTLEGGAIRIGDLLTSAETPGHAMKATRSGRVIGMALDDFDGGKGPTGKIVVFINNHWLHAR